MKPNTRRVCDVIINRFDITLRKHVDICIIYTGKSIQTGRYEGKKEKRGKNERGINHAREYDVEQNNLPRARRGDFFATKYTYISSTGIDFPYHPSRRTFVSTQRDTGEKVRAV